MTNDTNSSTFSNEAWEDYLIGGIFLATTVIVFIFYTPCLIVMVRNKELWKSSCIRVSCSIGFTVLFECVPQIMFNMGIADMVNVFTHGTYAMCTILRLEHTLPPRFELKEEIDKCSSLQCQ